MESRLANIDESFEPLLPENDDFVASPSGYLTQGESEDPAMLVANEELGSIQHAGLTEALAALDDRARDIVQSRWLYDEKMSLKDLAERYGVSIERIRQVEAKALKSMQSFVAAEAA
jgi:RNA polymerase sigma-32 factor